LDGCESKSNYLVIWPETAITGEHFISKLNADTLLKHIKKNICEKYKSYLISGIFNQELVDEYTPGFFGEKMPFLHTTKKGKYYLNYNSSLFFNFRSDSLQIHAKDKLVPFEEKIPYHRIFGNIKKHIPSLGNFAFAIKDNNKYLFKSTDNSMMITPLICFESAFSEYTSQSIRRGTNLIVVILNEDWYCKKNIRGAEIFQDLSIIRSIENRRSVARSSNGGITSLINHKGEVIENMNEPKQGGILGELPLINKTTFYTKSGNYLGRLSCFLLIGLIIAYTVKLFLNNKQNIFKN